MHSFIMKLKMPTSVGCIASLNFSAENGRINLHLNVFSKALPTTVEKINIGKPLKSDPLIISVVIWKMKKRLMLTKLIL